MAKQELRRGLRMWQLSPDTAATLYSWAAWILLAGTLLVLLGTIGTLWAGAEVSRHSDARLATAEVETAKANQAAAEANASAELAKLEAERIKGAVKWRMSPPDQQAAITRSLGADRGEITIAHTMNDPEALTYAATIAHAFQSANWNVHSMSVSFYNRVLFGVHLPPNTSTAAERVRTALDAAGIEYVREPFPQPSYTVGVSPPPGVFLMVGSRQPISLIGESQP